MELRQQAVQVSAGRTFQTDRKQGGTSRWAGLEKQYTRKKKRTSSERIFSSQGAALKTEKQKSSVERLEENIEVISEKREQKDKGMTSERKKYQN